MVSDVGGVSCVGRNQSSHLGIGPTTDHVKSPTSMLTSTEKVVKISVGRGHTCIIYIQGGLSCSGKNSSGALGVRDYNDRNSPTAVLLDNSAVEVEVGFDHTCLIDSAGDLLCMGDNSQGQLGVNDNSKRNTPTPVNLPTAKTVVELGCGWRHTCFIDNGYALWCMGLNSAGQLGLGHNNAVNSPTLVPNLQDDAVKIAAGYEHTCFILINDTVWCMGRNQYIQLGGTTSGTSNTPVKVDLPDSVIPLDIGLGSYHSCVSTSAISQIYCWGWNVEGRLGIGSGSGSYTPTLLQSLDWPTPSPAITTSPTPSITPVPTITKPNRNEWIISTTGNSTEQATSKDTILISTPFNTSNRDHAALVFEANCITPFDNDSYFTIGTTTPTSNAPDGFIQFNTTLGMNITAINSTKYWNAFTDGTRGGWVQACIETYLEFTDDPKYGNGGEVEKVTFKNSVLNISVSLTASYDVDQVSVVREEATEEDVKTDYSEFIKAYECADTSPYLPVTSNTYSQGDEIVICVTDESGGIVQVEEFVDLVISQQGITDYNFILNTLYNPDITSVDCLDATASERRVCIAKIRALTRFFEGEAPKDLTISGSVYVIRDGRRVRRNLRMALPAPEKIHEEEDNALAVVAGRRDEEKEEGSGEFQVQVSLVSADGSAASNRIIGSAAEALIPMIVGAAGAALLF